MSGRIRTFALTLFLVASSAWAGTMEKHVGVVISVDRTHLTIDELGPWNGQDTQPKRYTFQLTGTTRVALAERTPEGSNGWPWAFSEQWLQRADLRPGDFVTVTADRHDGNTTAVSVLAVRPGSNLDIPGSS
jgi:hypothetical protein